MKKQKNLKKRKLIKYGIFIIIIFLLIFYLSYNFNIGGQFVSVVNQITTSVTTTTIKPTFKATAAETVKTTTIITTTSSTTTPTTVVKATTTIKSSGGGGSKQKTTTTSIPKHVAKIIINEIMYNPPGSDDNNEWIEVYNNDTIDCDISDWNLFETGTNHRLTLQQGSMTVPSGTYVIITDNATNFLVNQPDFNGTVIKCSFSLNNDGEYIALKDYSSNVVDGITYNSSYGGNGNNRTLEREGNDWYESLFEGGTPGFENSIINVTTTTVSTTTITTTTILTSTTLTSSSSTSTSTTLPSTTTSSTTTSTSTSTTLTSTSTSSSSTSSSTTSTTTSTSTSTTTSTTSTIPIIADHVVISEIQVGDEEFVELYNPTNTDVNISDWYFSYFSSNKDWNNPYRNKKFPDNTTIKPFGFYLIGLNGYPIPISDWQPYSSKQLSDYDGSVAIFPFDPTTKTSDESRTGRIDAIGWGNPIYVYENTSCLVLEIGKSLERKPGYLNSTAGNGWDSDNNLEDFILRNETEAQNTTFVEIF